MKFLVVLVLAVFTGCHGRLVHQPRPQVAMVKDAFWDYVARATLTSEDSLKQIRESALGHELNVLISESTEAIKTFADTMRTQVAPLTQDLMAKVTQEAELLKARLEKDLAAVSTNLQPYTEDLESALQRHVEELKSGAESMDPESLKAVMQQKSQELKEQLDTSVKQMQDRMVPITEEIKQKMEQSLEEFQRSMVPVAQSFQTQLTQKTQEIQENLAPYGEEIRVRLDKDTEQLKKQLSALWSSFTKLTQ
ncbi:apolipoprotein A-IV-like [Platichthys flesus]|uniref:apolipoprotein A-IV-like n=1 Tax=Platichthys flesus TaxID=8260 RepID=UPI002DBCC83A|nr:apolipoprotein A-IV-like [Platichthys flesus]XP_062265722.1 apolipoprotein A-IV-like [Platichthys flesus]